MFGDCAYPRSERLGVRRYFIEPGGCGKVGALGCRVADIHPSGPVPVRLLPLVADKHSRVAVGSRLAVLLAGPARGLQGVA